MSELSTSEQPSTKRSSARRASAGRRASSDLWREPWRTLRTLESFARTEADGGKDIATAARVVSDHELRQHLLRHADDEARHAELFHARAAELRGAVAANPVVSTESDRIHDLSSHRSSADLDAHGFFKSGLIDELGEVAYVAMLHVAEKKASALFADLERQTANDPATQAIFTQILKDEKYHVAYTGRCLENWRKRGRDAEVRQALREARGSRFLGGLRRAGMRSAAGFGRFVLRIAYFTFLAPFGWLTARRSLSGGWQATGEVQTSHEAVRLELKRQS